MERAYFSLKQLSAMMVIYSTEMGVTTNAKLKLIKVGSATEGKIGGVFVGIEVSLMLS